jgi:phosphatidylglycerophosphate synthase
MVRLCESEKELSMFDVKLRTIVDPLLFKIARKLPFKADHVTLLALIPAILAFIFILDGEFTLALICVLLNRLCDGLDGTIARLNTPTKRGGFLDITCDFIFYGLIPLAFAFQDFDNAPASSLLLFAFYINGGAFLANAMLTDNTSEKAFSYMAGLTEGAETIAFFTAFCLFPAYYAPLALIFAALCLISAIARIYSFKA